MIPINDPINDCHGIDDEMVYSLQDTYESNWRREAGLPALRVQLFLEEIGIGQGARSTELFLAICQIDIERDWMWWKHHLLQTAKPFAANLREEAGISALTRELDKNAKASDYESLAMQFGIPIAQCQALVESEIKSRAQFGDFAISARDSRCRELKLPKPLIATIKSPSGGCIQAEMNGKLEFGRQRSFEPQLGRNGNRVAICSDPRVSRSQFSAQLLSREFLLVENLSNSMIPVILDRGSLLQGQERAMVPLPATLKVADIEILVSES
jgi:hypothetical protein